jgi:thioredoxin 1
MAFLAATTCAGAAPLPYDETANTTVEIERALAATAGTSRDVLLIFGANWCEDCRALDAALKDAKNAALIATEFQVVKIDVGRFDRNLDVSARYGNPIRKGIPAAVILSPSGQVLFATRAGELADARTMSETGVHDFFRNAAFSARTKK